MDEEGMYECDYIRCKNPSVLLEKLISLLQEQVTRNDVQRHKEYLYKLAIVCSRGFLMRDLHELMMLIEILLGRIDDFEEYSELLEIILNICAYPPIKTIASDILKYTRPFDQFFTILGYTLACLKNPNLQIVTANSIFSLLTKKYPQYRCYTSLEERLHSARNSLLSEILANLLQFADEEVYPRILDITVRLIRNSDQMCKVFVNEDALNSLFMRLEPTWKERYPDKPPPSVPVANVLNYDKFTTVVLVLLRYMGHNMKKDEEMKNIKNFHLFSLWYVLEELRIVYKLLAIASNKHCTTWKTEQACVIRRVALEVLMKIVPGTEEEFIESSGPITFLEIISLYKPKDVDLLIFKKCLEALLYILRTTTIVTDSILYNNGLKLLLDVCEDIVNTLLEHNVAKECLALVFCILDILFKHSKEKDDRIIPIIFTYFGNIVPPHKEVYIRDIREIICVLNFVWDHIVKMEDMAKEFVQKDGTYLLLDMIQKFPLAIKLVSLGALVDLCEHGLCIPYLITWKRNGETILPMLLKLFREENQRNKVKRGPRDQIADSRYPLMGKDQWFLTFCTCKPMMPGNACISDLFLSVRPKVYAILQMLQIRHAEKVEIANEHYKTLDTELTSKDQVTKLMAENFLALKVGEAWVELKEDFARSLTRLTALDNVILLYLTQRVTKFAEYIQLLQNEIVQKGLEKDVIKEYELYVHIEDAQLTEALEALSELKHIARSSENMFRISEKYKHSKQIDDALKTYEVDVNRTFLDIRVTPVFDETIDLTKHIYTTEEDEELKLVSPTESNNECDIDIPEDYLVLHSDIKLSCNQE